VESIPALPDGEALHEELSCRLPELLIEDAVEDDVH
jgi:hypothetical protein